MAGKFERKDYTYMVGSTYKDWYISEINKEGRVKVKLNCSCGRSVRWTTPSKIIANTEASRCRKCANKVSASSRFTITVGMVVGDWEVVRYEYTIKKSRYWLCRHKPCGLEAVYPTHYISIHFPAKNGKCRGCMKCAGKAKLQTDSGINYIWRNILLNAKDRQIDVKISKEEVFSILYHQQYKCALTGETLTLPTSNAEAVANKCTASFDRIDSYDIYRRGNVQWVSKIVNMAKCDRTQDDFIYFCSLVANKNNAKYPLIASKFSDVVNKPKKINYIWSNICKGARKRDIGVQINYDFIVFLLKEQNFRCALTGIPLYVLYNKNKIVCGGTASLDRVNSEGIYENGNVQWVHKYINLMKLDLPEINFIVMCKKVASYKQPVII